MLSLGHLEALNIASNSLFGEIPYLNLPSLQQINLFNNNLTGGVPKSLLRFPTLVFGGNNISFESIPLQTFPFVEPYRTSKSGRLGETTLLGIIITSCVMGIVACRCPILSRLLFFRFNFVGPWARLCQGSSLGLEPIPFCCLFILSVLLVVFC